MEYFGSPLRIPTGKTFFHSHSSKLQPFYCHRRICKAATARFVFSSEASDQLYFSHYSTFRFVLGNVLLFLDKYSWKGEKSISFLEANRSYKDKITCFFGYCNPNCIQYSWGTWLILSKLSTMFGFKHLHCLLAPMHRQCIKVDSFNPYK